MEFSKQGLLLPSEEPYQLTLEEIGSLFGTRGHARRNIFDGLQRGVENLFDGGVERIILGGSYISLKADPGDADMAWWYNENIDWDVVDPVFQDPKKSAARGKFLIDQKIDGIEDISYEYSHEYFLRTNTRMPTGYQKVGIVRIVFGGIT